MYNTTVEQDTEVAAEGYTIDTPGRAVGRAHDTTTVTETAMIW